jgi:hypothetical protein
MPDSRPKTIQVYLPDGNARSIRIAEITSRTVQATQIPRQKLDLAESRKEPQRIGVYFLFGESADERTETLVYIDRAANCFRCISSHHRNTDFWTMAVTITSQFQNFTEAHARQLAYDCIWAAKEAQDFRLKNTQLPNDPRVSEAVLAESEDNFGTIQELLSVLGFSILDPSPKKE